MVADLKQHIESVLCDSERFQQLTEEDLGAFSRPDLVFLAPPPTNDAASCQKRINWIQWRAAPYPASRHSEYLFLKGDLTETHPRILLSAVLDVSDGVDDYLSRFSKKQRYQVTGRKAANSGFYTKKICPSFFSEEIWEIVHSSSERQGRRIAEMYDSRPKDYNFPDYGEYGDPNYRDICIGAFSPSGKLTAYILGKRVGDHVQYDEILGHMDFISSHALYLAHFGFIQSVIEQNPVPKCLNYGPWYSGTNPFSAEGGLNRWKRKMGFRPAYLIGVC